MNKTIEKKFNELLDIISQYNPDFDKDLITKSYLFFYNNFSHEKDSFLLFPIEVTLCLIKLEPDDISIASSLLINIFLKNDIKKETIEKEFSIDIANIIDGVYKLSKLKYSVDLKKEELIDFKKSLISVGNDIRIYLIKVAERYHVLNILSTYPKEQRYFIAKEAEDVYIPILNFLSIGEYIANMHNLCFKYTNESEYNKIYKVFGSKYKLHENIIRKSYDNIEYNFKKTGIKIVKIEGRVKSMYSIYKKIIGKKLDINSVHDVLALRVITNTVSDAYLVLGVIHKLYTIKRFYFKDYISSPKTNGYQAIHTTVNDESGEMLEFQILTKEMAKLNKTGFAAHFLYKGFGMDYKDFPDWMKGVIDIQKETINSEEYIKRLKNELTIMEIRCFDQNGKIYILPKFSVLIDFAFLYSEENGKKFSGAYVNGVFILYPFFVLKNNDLIELKKGDKYFINYNLQNFYLIKTEKAKNGIQKLFSTISEPKSVELGQYNLNMNLDNLGLKHFSYYPNIIKDKILKKIGLDNENNLYLFIGTGNIDLNYVINTIIEFSNKDGINKKISLKIFLKTKDFLSINNIINIFFNFNVNIKKLIFKEGKNYLNISFMIDTNENLKLLLAELKRTPNIFKIIRVSQLKFIIFYTIYAFILTSIIGIVIFIFYYDLIGEKGTIAQEFFLFIINFILVSFLLIIKYVVKRFLSNIIYSKRYWFLLFLLNTFILLIFLFEILILGLHYNFFLFFLISFIAYISLSYSFYKIHLNEKL